MSDEVQYTGLCRTPENGGRRSRTLRLDDDTAQVQAKEAKLLDPPRSDDEGPSRYLQLRYWTAEAGWTHLVIDPRYAGIAGIVSVGHDEVTEHDSWEMARASANAQID